ncbi:MAG: hypothetical protein WC916_05410 [Candidatus Woesearchaeota archaeon]
MMDYTRVVNKTIEDILSHPKKDQILRLWTEKEFRLTGIKKQKTDKDLETATKEYLELIVPKPNAWIFSFANTILRLMTWNNYTNWHVEGQEYLEQLHDKTWVGIANHVANADHFPIGFKVYNAGYHIRKPPFFPSIVAGNNLFAEWKVEEGIKTYHHNNLKEWVMRAANATILHRDFIDEKRWIKDNPQYGFVWKEFNKNILIAGMNSQIYPEARRMRPDSSGTFIPPAFDYIIAANKIRPITGLLMRIDYETPPDAERVVAGKERAMSVSLLDSLLESFKPNRWGEVCVQFLEPLPVGDMDNITFAREAEKKIWSATRIYATDAYAYAKMHFDNTEKGVAFVQEKFPKKNHGPSLQDTPDYVIDHALSLFEKYHHLTSKELLLYFSRKVEIALKYVKE